MSDPQPTMPENFLSGDAALPKAGRFVCRSTERPKRKAKRLKRALQEAGYDVRLQKCFELIAQMYGYANYHELHCTVDGVTCSADDEAVDEAMFAARFWSQVQKLVEMGVSPRDAEEIIELHEGARGLARRGCDAERVPPPVRRA